ncbi:hypothetical protein LCGC14_2130370 [marine sediment metagenome]|uniref:Uncharacterized protein n=1 Tax=marine sediment metagenome TaxID=412755 RepID=A0A0F9ENT0_9ZZZZ
MENENKKCKDLVKENYESRIKDLITLWDSEEGETEELGGLADYGLDISKVEAGTFEKQREDYIRYQLSWGGPSDEFRIFKNGDVEYWYMDWNDGAKIEVVGKYAKLIKDVVSIAIDLSEFIV